LPYEKFSIILSILRTLDWWLEMSH
jgi:hypothetical protein